MFPIGQFLDGFGQILWEMDALAQGGAGEALEAMEDLNAEFEDALMLLNELKREDVDWREELDGALEALRALAGDYRAIQGGVPGVEELAGRLEMAVEQARNSLEGE